MRPLAPAPGLPKGEFHTVWFSEGITDKDVAHHMEAKIKGASIFVVYDDSNDIIGIKTPHKPILDELKTSAFSLPEGTPLFPDYEKLKDLLQKG